MPDLPVWKKGLISLVALFSILSHLHALAGGASTFQLAQLAQESQKKTPEIVHLGIPNFNNINLPYYVAMEKGYYREEGIELRLIRVQGNRAVAALLTGDVQFDVLGTTAVTARFNGAPLKIITSTLERPPFFLYAKPEIDHVNQLKGESIATTVFGSAPPFFLTRIFKEHFGWSDPEREVRWHTVPQPLLALVTGNAKAAVVSEDKGKADAQGMKMLLDVRKYIRAAFGATVATEDVLKKQGALVERFLRPLLKALWSLQEKDKKEEAIKILAKWTKSDEPYARGLFEITQDSWAADGTASLQAMKLSLEMSRRELKSVRREVTPEDMYDFGPVRKVKQQLEASAWRP